MVPRNSAASAGAHPSLPPCPPHDRFYRRFRPRSPCADLKLGHKLLVLFDSHNHNEPSAVHVTARWRIAEAAFLLFLFAVVLADCREPIAVGRGARFACLEADRFLEP
jgi:hypothetical protein